jgi:hypothetical protein
MKGKNAAAGIKHLVNGRVKPENIICRVHEERGREIYGGMGL